MNGFWELLNQPLGQRLGWTLVHSLWEGAVGALVFGIVRLGMRNRSANARYLASCLMLVVLLAAPIGTVFCPPPAWKPEPSFRSNRRLFFSDVNPSPSAVGLVSAPRRDSDSLPYPLADAARINQVLPWIVLLWSAGVVALSCRWLYGSHWLQRVKTSRIELIEPAWRARLDELRARLRIARPVTLLKSALVEVPIVVGWLRPVILLPAGALTGLTPGQIEAILAHELAHVRRHDYLVNWFQNVVETLMFYHPAVWWVSRCIREEREHCCDDLVVRVCGDKLQYARALMTLEEARAVPRLAFAASDGSLLQRVRRLLGVSDTRPPTPAEFGGLALVVAGCLMMLMAFWFFSSPAIYQAAALLRISPNLLVQSGSAGPGGAPEAYYPYLLQTECLVMRSPAVLKGVIGSLQLPPATAEKSRRADQLASLKACLSLRPIPGTSVIEVQATDPDPARAARLANAVSISYRQYRLEHSRLALSGTTEALKRQLAQEDKKVRQAQDEVDRLRLELKVPEGWAAENLSTPALSAESLRHLEMLRIEGDAEYVKQKVLLENLERVDPSELPQTIPAVGLQDGQLNEYLQASAVVDQKLVSLQKDLGPENPEVLKALAQQADLRQKVKDRILGTMTGLRARLAATGKSLVTLSNAVAQARDADMVLASRSRPFLEAKRDLEELERFRSVLTAKLSMEQTTLPLDDLVEVVEEAVAPGQPAGSNRSRAQVLLTAGLLLALSGALLSKAARASRGVAK